MKTNVLEFLEETSKIYPDKVAFSDGTYNISFSEFVDRAKRVGCFLADKGYYSEPIVVFMEKHPDTINAFWGVVYSGCFYIPIDSEMPTHRINLIFQNLNPRAIIYSAHTKSQVENLWPNAALYSYEEIINHEINNEVLCSIRDKQLDTDLLYVVFTSGSTGMPKGVAAAHRSVIDYAEHLLPVLEVDADSTFAMQSPLYFDACLKEICSAFFKGSSVYLLPKELFMQPIALVNYLNEHKVTNLCWVVSALTLISGLGALKEVTPKHLKTVAFGSEVFPIKQFNLWRNALPNARFINLYGPTECTGMSCYYIVDREFALDEVIPIGRPFKNTGLFLLDDNDRLAENGQVGEICIKGTPLTVGYYNDFERTQEVFVQNPLNTHYPELIYRTGDLAKYNEHGELVFISRKDYQIKHMGHRIELGEIELIANMAEGVSGAACVFDQEKKKIILFYTGIAEAGAVNTYLREKLPVYMIPSKISKLVSLPLTANGKLDRKSLLANYK